MADAVWASYGLVQRAKPVHVAPFVLCTPLYIEVIHLDVAGNAKELTAII
jgi:hypothetical protein